jgi:hypothetical protein
MGARALQALSFTSCFMSISVIVEVVRMIVIHSRHNRYGQVRGCERETRRNMCAAHVMMYSLHLVAPCPGPHSRQPNHRLSPS